jgi:hypothetical protein
LGGFDRERSSAIIRLGDPALDIGYGYRPALALSYLAGLFAIGWVVFSHTYPTALRPAMSGPGQPEFNAARYTLDLLLPVATLHQREAFVPRGYATWWAFGLTLAGWLLAPLGPLDPRNGPHALFEAFEFSLQTGGPYWI